MKNRSKIIALSLLGAALVLSMGGCGEKSTKTDSKTVVVAGDDNNNQATKQDKFNKVTDNRLQSIYDGIVDNKLLPNMNIANEEYIKNYYGVDANLLKHYIFAVAEDATKADTVVICEVKNSDDIDSLKNQLSVILEQKGDEMKNYEPKQYKLVKEAKVESEGDYVYLVISPNRAEIIKAIKEGLSK